MTNDFIKSSDSDRLDWNSNYKTQIVLAAQPLGLTPQQVTDFCTPCDDETNAINEALLAKNVFQIKTDAKATQIVTSSKQKRANANYIKALPGYTAGIGAALRIIGSSNSGVDTVNFKPTMTVSAGNGVVTLKFIKNGGDGVNVYIRLKGTTDWTFMALDTHRPYSDNLPLANPAVPANREYIHIGVLDDMEIDVPSDTASITFAG